MRSTIRHLTPRCSNWPGELDTIPSPPTDLWSLGSQEQLDHRPRIAIVGSRSPTPYGEAQARRFAYTLARAGFAIVSGLARGIDQTAHLAALDAGGVTLAVLGSGVDRPWPRGEASERVQAHGLLLSEFPPGQAPRRHHFPMRNRLISGLSLGVIVIEAAQASGSLITAHWANDQGREVFAVPGRVDHPMSRGTHRLIREGALLVESPEDVISNLLSDERLPLVPPPSRSQAPDHAAGNLRGDASCGPLLEALRGETLTVDELSQRLDLPVAQVLSNVAELELGGAILRAPGGLFRLAVEGG